MELKELVTLFRRWIWLLIFGLILGLACGFAASKIQSPVYEASAKVLVTRNRQQGVTDLVSLTDQQLVSTYQQLLKTQPVLAEAGSRLGINIDPDTIRIDVILNTQILQIKVQDKNASQAAAIANMLVQILIEQNETLQAGRYAVFEEGLNSQIAQVQGQIVNLQGQITQINQISIEEQLAQVNQQIADLQNQMSTLEKDIAAFPASPSTSQRASLAEKQAQIDQLRSLLYLYQQIQTNLTFIGKPVEGNSGRDDPRVTSLQSTLNLYQQLYLTLLNNLEAAKLARAQSTPTVTQIEDATLPKRPVRPIPLLYTALSGMVGLFLAAGQILLMEHLDDTFTTARKVQDLLRIPVIGQINDIELKRKWYEKAEMADRSNAQRENAFGSLRISLSRLMTGKSHKSILVTSASQGEGKTTVSANLAKAFVQSGKRVILVDADMHHPQLHSRLGLSNEVGLSNILSGTAEWQDAARGQDDLTVIMSGTSGPVPSGLLDSERMTELLKKLQKNADVVIVDGPPLFVVDAQILASKVGGVLLVIQQGGTKTAAARSMVDQLELMGVNMLGVVLNRVPQGDTYYDGYYRNVNGKKPREAMEEHEELEKDEPI